MNEKTYPFGSPRVDFRYEFMSVNQQNQVQKVVRFRPTNIEGLYNLALLDVLPDGTTSDTTVTNNKDMVIVLATVMQIVIDFFNKNPGNSIVIQGSDARRQRLYQILIGRELELISERFDVFGVNGTNVEPFHRNHSYEFFIITDESDYGKSTETATVDSTS